MVAASPRASRAGRVERIALRASGDHEAQDGVTDIDIYFILIR